MREVCNFCKIKHPKVEMLGMWHCPNALCSGPGAGWFRQTLESYKELKDGRHKVNDKEWNEKGYIYNLAKGIEVDKLINKVKKDEKKAQGALKKGMKDTKTLLKADKKMDKKMEKCEKEEKKMKKRK